jgi:hypothetical protein
MNRGKEKIFLVKILRHFMDKDWGKRRCQWLGILNGAN